jgi:hypothetical protein
MAAVVIVASIVSGKASTRPRVETIIILLSKGIFHLLCHFVTLFPTIV